MYAISKGGILLLTYEKDDNANSGTLGGIFGKVPEGVTVTQMCIPRAAST